MKHPSRWVVPTIAGCLAAALTVSIAAADGLPCLDQTGCAHCPVCDHVCRLKAEPGKAERDCFQVESKVICIPRVVFPWQNPNRHHNTACRDCDGSGCHSCRHNGARLRRIRVLRPDRYTCDVCDYSWSVEKRPRAGQDCIPPGDAPCDDTCDGPVGMTNNVYRLPQLEPRLSTD